MAITVYNTLTRKKEPFKPITAGKVGIYLCGPTVYKPSHIGHAVGPIIFDAVKRYLVHRGFDVTWVVNITDVDDKLIVEAEKQGVTTFELAERITKDYLDAMKKLHVDTIDIMPKASESMADIIGVVKTLIEKGVAYESGGDVYFDVTKHPGYGKLSNRKLDDQEGQRDLQSSEKRHPADFALWKAAKPEEPEEVKFDSPWGKGRPGWHIECSAMSQRYLGDTFDIHGGGMDLIFPHHENEIAQSEAATGKPFAKVWMHNGLTRVNTKKISKSDASPEMQAALARMTLHNLLDAYPPELIRFFVLSTQYRRPIEYSEEEIAGKRKGLDTFYRLFERVERLCGESPYVNAPERGCPIHCEAMGGGRTKESAASPTPDRSGSATFAGAKNGAPIQSEMLSTACEECDAAFHRAMDDDFNTAGAIAALFDFAGAINRFIEQEKLEASEPRTSVRADSTGSEPRTSVRADSTEIKLQAKRDSERQASACANAQTATTHLIAVAQLIGLFLEPQEKKTGGDDGLTDSVMQVLIQVRQHLRKKKDFETSDLIRDLLTERKITLEDRPDGTIWRSE